MRYYVAPGIGGNTWASAGDLVSTLNHVINNPSPIHDDEIWARQGTYNLAGNPLVINQNTAPLSIYGGFAGWENTLCDRDANIISNDPDFPDFFQNPSILDGGGSVGWTNRVIEMQGANVCRIDGFVVRNGNAGTGDGGGLYVHGRNIWLENLVIMNNVAGNNGGGILVGNV